MVNPTINDVARIANTSKSTVSRFLNGYTVKKETEEALKLAIQSLNYHPNVNARRLVKNHTQSIGIVVDDIANNFYSGIYRGIENVANLNGYQCTYYSRTSNYQGEFGFMDLAQERQVDGLILISFLKRSNELIKRIEELMTPVVLIGDTNSNDTIFSVDVDNELGICEVVRYLHRLGHEKIGYITGPDEFSATHWRRKGYEGALKDLGIKQNPSWIIASDWSESGGHKAMKELLDMNEITAVIASNDEMAIGALLCANELGYRVPSDISIVGFDDIPVAKWVYPPLTSVKQPFVEMGEKAAIGLIEKLNGEEIGTQSNRVLIKPNLVVRQSCRGL
ncbi:LacI family DNA-binding transcriptional regulator [Metabacillus halosaccharovorans]|uniref:LacI family DNA-binding transcriptional regulator n=1 Tax=Metabacillus halosaccharovorans TaxID=930124 RepID=UPI0009958270|nr:LacI family DNA-binding transcriptional regulator [Metabacillus halosaccharovorans]